MNTAFLIQSDLDSRTLIYRQLAKLFRFPNSSSYHELSAGQWSSRLGHAVDQVIEDVFRDSDHEQYSDLYMRDAPMQLSADEYEVEYIALYEVGLGGAPCPLHSGHYGRDRMKTMEEVLRFYRFFDYQPNRSPDLFPDHLSFELEFMAHLSELGHRARLEEADDPVHVASFTLAQRDFISRQLLPWVLELKNKIEKESHYEFFKKSGHLLNRFIQLDCEYLELESSNSKFLEKGICASAEIGEVSHE